MRSPITIAEVAREAGVSVSTVSRVLNGTANVSPQKRTAVESILERLRYQPNVLARGLASGRTMTVGVLSQDISSPFYADTLRGIEHGLAGSGYHPIFVSGHWHAEQETEAIDVLLSRQVDAMIVLGGFTPDERLQAVAQQVPLLVFGRRVVGMETQCLRFDNVSGAYEATRHLIELGHRSIAHIAGVPSHRDAQQRLQGYRSALEDAGLEYDPELVVAGDFLEQSGFMTTCRLIEGRKLFTAVFAANDQMAYGARLALARKGFRVPDDVSLVGFDDLPGSSFTTPPLTTVRQPAYEGGVSSAQGVLRMLRGEKPELPALGLSLVVRESTSRRR